jgi:hypothetical protein
MFPSDMTNIEPHSQRLALLVVANVVMLCNSLDELLPSPPPARSPIVAFLPTDFCPRVFLPTRFPSHLYNPAAQILKSDVSDGVGA